MPKVLIDDVEYMPVPQPVHTQGLAGALEVRFDSDAGENLTVREYLTVLLTKVWEEKEGFSGKRPFGNSGWEHDIYAPLAKAGYIRGDDDGYVAPGVDRSDAFFFVSRLIKAAMQ